MLIVAVPVPDKYFYIHCKNPEWCEKYLTKVFLPAAGGMGT